jgi:CRP-like cAMP-binding protein
MKDGDLSQVFLNSKVFSSVSEDELSDLMKKGALQNFDAGQVLFMSGERGDSVYLIISGIVTISDLTIGGREVIVNSLSRGDVFGEIAVLDGENRTMGATCETELEAIVISKKDFLDFIKGKPDMLYDLIDLLCGRVRWCTKVLETAIFQSVLGRIIYQLFALIEKGAYVEVEGDKAKLDISQEQLSKMVGSSREVVNRNLQFLAKDGVISLKRGGIIVPTISGLRKYMENKNTEKA